MASETNYELKNALTEAIWDLVEGECIEHPADAFEEAIGLFYDLMEDEEVTELIERTRRNKGG